ncbi:MAG: DNA (cytosine-5-)-methyltransferase [Gallionella sp.]|nr:DNA (cytosine-5-)-methyltransferase [Gallionella sp.]
MNTTLTLVSDQDTVLSYLDEARKHHTQAAIAKHLGVGVRTISRWEARQTSPPAYLAHALQQLLPFGDDRPEGAFDFIDLFAGIGGLRKAFEQIGGRCVFTSEWDSYAQKTYAENFRDRHPIAGDITQVQAADIPDHDVLLAGFPCQPFSIAGVSKKNALGKAHGFACETQGTLFFDVARIIETKRPRAFLLENVKNLVSHDKGRTFDVIRRTLTEVLGYHIHYRVIDGAHFVPQHRERILIVGFREPIAFDFDALPLPPKGVHKLKDILHRTDGSEPVLPWDEGRFFDHKKQRPQDKYTLTDNLWLYLQNYAAKHRAKGNGFGFGLVKPGDVTRTLSARYYKDGSEILVYQGTRKNPRRLTPRECARLMGYPDTFRIPVSDTRAYRLFSQAAVVPMVEYAAKLMVSQLNLGEKAPEAKAVEMPKDIMAKGLWTKEQVKLAFHLYCQLPYGRIYGRNPEIIALAKVISRTPDAVAMKMLNIASLDPAITSTGRVGLGNASALDREVWDEFHSDWERLAVECQLLRQQLDKNAVEDLEQEDDELLPDDFTGETRQVLTTQRIKQHFFRRAVLSSYRGRCCISGLSDARLLMASHIVPWSNDKANRLNPSNGLCLSAIHDKAFDRGLITISDNYEVMLSEQLKRNDDAFVVQIFLPLEGRKIELPEKFIPSIAFLARHRSEIFIDVAGQ